MRVATIIHTSPVTGMAVDVGAIAAAIRGAAPGCFNVVDGIQHASHGAVDIAALGIDNYATFSDAVDYLDWLGSQVTPDSDRRKRLEAAAKSIHGHKQKLADTMMTGSGNVLEPLGLADCVRVSFSHYNTEQDVAQFLTALNEFVEQTA